MKSLKTEFIAENELIEIITNRNIAQIKLITVYQINKGTYGPFQPLERHTVPIWLAILFKNKHKCKIINPEFLDPSILGLTVYLKDQLQQEQQSLEFSDLPFFYQEISNLLLAFEDVPHSVEIKNLLDDLKQVRASKVRVGVSSLDGQYLQTNNFAAAEIESVRLFFTKAFDEIRRLSV